MRQPRIPIRYVTDPIRYRRDHCVELRKRLVYRHGLFEAVALHLALACALAAG